MSLKGYEPDAIVTSIEVESPALYFETPKEVETPKEGEGEGPMSFIIVENARGPLVKRQGLWRSWLSRSLRML